MLLERRFWLTVYRKSLKSSMMDYHISTTTLNWQCLLLSEISQTVEGTNCCDISMISVLSCTNVSITSIAQYKCESTVNQHWKLKEPVLYVKLTVWLILSNFVNNKCQINEIERDVLISSQGKWFERQKDFYKSCFFFTFVTLTSAYSLPLYNFYKV